MEKQNDYKAELDLITAIQRLKLSMQERLKIDKLIEDAINEAYMTGKAEGKADERDRVRLGYPIVD